MSCESLVQDFDFCVLTNCPSPSRGVKVPQPNYLAKRPGQPKLSPSHSDYSPSDDFVPRLLFPTSSTSPTPKTRTRSAGGLRPDSPTRQPQVILSARPKSKPVARKLFASEIAAAEAGEEKKAKPSGWTDSSASSSSTGLSEGHGALNVKARAFKQGIKKGEMSAAMGVAHAHGPVRPGGRSGALKREDTFELHHKKATKGQRDEDDEAPELPNDSLRRSPRVAMLAKSPGAGRKV